MFRRALPFAAAVALCLATAGCGPKQQDEEMGPVSESTQKAIEQSETSPAPKPPTLPNEPPGDAGQEQLREVK